MKNKNYTILYIIVNIILYTYLGIYLKMNYNLVFYSIGIVTFVLYYISDVFDFEKNYEKSKNVLYSGILNGVLFFITLFIFEFKEALILYGAQFLYQAIMKHLILKYLVKPLNLLIIGKNYKSEMIEKVVKDRGLYNFIGTIDEKKKSNKLGSIKDLKKIVKKYKVDKIAIVVEGILKKELLEDLQNLKLNGIRLFDFYNFYEELEGKIPVKIVAEEWFLFDRGFNILYNDFQQRVKRVVDLIFAIVIMIPAIPIMLISVIIIKLESKGSVFFIQERIGKGNRPFKIIKFRSMQLHDENKFSKYAGEKDSRITRYGNIMRKTRIDELPQLLNILKGEMSFVGPRAEWDKLCYGYMEKIPFYNLRHAVLPGLTGWAQVNYPYGASVEDAFEKLQYDLYYIKHQSISLDIIIFLKTIKTVVFGRGR